MLQEEEPKSNQPSNKSESPQVRGGATSSEYTSESIQVADTPHKKFINFMNTNQQFTTKATLKAASLKDQIEMLKNMLQKMRAVIDILDNFIELDPKVTVASQKSSEEEEKSEPESDGVSEEKFERTDDTL